MADYINQLKKTINYIEENLTSCLTLEDISKVAGLSAFHFTRIFHRLMGETLSSYIRKRRLTEAAGDLQKNRLGIIDIAFKYQFQSQASFTKSFKKHFKTTPKKIKKLPTIFKLGEVKPLNFEHLVHRTSGMVSLEPDIISYGPIKLVGKRCSNSLDHNTIPQLWRRFISQMNKINYLHNSGLYGVSIYNSDFLKLDAGDDFLFDYLAGVSVASLENIPRGMVGYEIPSREYAVFTHRGFMKEMPYTYDYIYRTWLPSSGRDFIYAEHFERWPSPEYKGDFEDSEILIYIPISL